MEQHAGIDLSLKLSSVCIVDQWRENANDLAGYKRGGG
jgi:hypothetical protein